MFKEILFATTNPHKIERFRAYYEPLGLNIISFENLGEAIEIIEDGKTPEENALKKAMAGHKATDLPCIGLDYWLEIEGFPEEIQPGPYVRRIFIGSNNERVEANDEEMLKYYIYSIDKIGGQTNGIWTSALALVLEKDKSFVESFSRKTLFTSIRSPNETPGEPLNSIQIDPGSGKYFTDLSPEEWLNLQKERERGYIEFIKKHLQDLS